MDTENANFTYMPMWFEDPPTVEEEFIAYKFLWSKKVSSINKILFILQQNLDQWAQNVKM